MKTRRTALAAVLVALSVSIVGSTRLGTHELGSTAHALSPADLPNVLFIVTDDQRADTARGALGRAVMPKTRKWFRDGSAVEQITGGTEFKNAYVTTPLCCPSRASIFTGRYVHNHGVEREPTDLCDDQPYTVQSYLKRVGYHTGIFGKYLNNWGQQRLSCPSYPANQPPYFDEFAIFDQGYVSLNPGADCGTKPSGTCVFQKQSSGATSYTELPEYSTTFVRKKAEAFIDRRKLQDSVPWFLYVAPFAPHGPPRDGSRALVSMTEASGYHGATVPAFKPGPAHNEVDRSDKPGWVKGTPSKPLGWSDKRQIFETKIDGTTYLGLREQQLRTLKAVDDLVDAIFRKLGPAEANNTLAIFISDNGYMWREHGPDTRECYSPLPEIADATPKACGISSKGMPYLDSVRVPFFMRWPNDSRVEKGTTKAKLVANIDLAPTVLDALGITPATVPMDGKSLLRTRPRSKLLLENVAIGVNGNVIPRWASLVTPTYHYTRYEDSSGNPLFQEWYDISPTVDPGERTNRFGIDGVPGPGEPAPPDLTAIRSCVGVACP